jgi:hypothetical protein
VIVRKKTFLKQNNHRFEVIALTSRAANSTVCSYR